MNRTCTSAPQFFFLVLIGIFISSSSAVNNLSVRQDVAHPTVIPGYIDEAVLVVEPYGGYSLQSLYIKYSDHGLLGGKVVVTHTFELPEGAVVNDLWLWIGDSIMQGKILERKHAQGLWDTITALKQDPALLKVSEKQFDLSVYPLTSGAFRKVKIQMMVPTRYSGTSPQITLPYKFLCADHNTQTPVRVLWRTTDGKYGQPAFVETGLPAISTSIDTLGKRYKAVIVPNIKALSSANISCDGRFTSGWVADVFRSGTTAYYSLGMYEPDFFNPKMNGSSAKKSFIGLDLSGIYGIDSTQFPSTVASFVSGYLKTGDSLKIVVAGEGLFDTLPKQGWYGFNDTTAVLVQSMIASGRVMAAKRLATKPRILFSDGADPDRLAGFYFPGVEKLADITLAARHSGLYGNINNFSQYDIIASLFHGDKNDVISPQQLDSLETALNAFFERGGTFVAQFVHNRDISNVAHRFFKGLQTPPGFVKGMLHRNIDGPIGHGFPNTFFYDNSEPLVHSDPDAVSEVLNENNVPVVISKKISNGRFILSSMWHMQDNAGLKKTLNTAELNLQNQSRYYQLGAIVKNLVTTYATSGLSEAVIMSNADFLITSSNMTANIDLATFNAAAEVPYIKTISLLDGVDYIPPAFTFNGQEFYGSGYWLKSIADRTGGSFFPRSTNTWSAIAQGIGPVNYYSHERFSLAAQSGATITTDSIFSCQASDPIYSNAHFYSGKAPFADALVFNSSVKYLKNDSTYMRSVSCPTSTILVADSALLHMFRMEILNKMLISSPLDSTAIVRFAVANRFLTDLTAFIALEPNDTTHFMKDPKDESNINPVAVRESLIKNASTVIFRPMIVNGKMTLIFSSDIAGTAVIKIFNLAGKCILTRTFSIVPGRLENISCQNAMFSRGVYVGVAQFKGVDGNAVRRIERFEVR